ncbi:MAG: zinc ribbon domain-containing protein [Dehalococcoidales bacterium]
MPIYERRCPECDAKFCHLSKVEDREKAKACTNCGHPDTKPIMSATPTTFKFHDAKAIKKRIDRQHGFGRLTGKDAKYYKDKHNMTPARNPRREE